LPLINRLPTTVHLRRDSKVAQDSETPLAAAICQELGPEEQAAADQMRDRLFAAVKGHDKELELRDFIQAALLIKDGSMVDKQMADLLDISPREVRSRRKKLPCEKTLGTRPEFPAMIGCIFSTQEART
jgi:hypothetical protein